MLTSKQIEAMRETVNGEAIGELKLTGRKAFTPQERVDILTLTPAECLEILDLAAMAARIRER